MLIILLNIISLSPLFAPWNICYNFYCALLSSFNCSCNRWSRRRSCLISHHWFSSSGIKFIDSPSFWLLCEWLIFVCSRCCHFASVSSIRFFGSWRWFNFIWWRCNFRFWCSHFVFFSCVLCFLFLSCWLRVFLFGVSWLQTKKVANRFILSLHKWIWLV